MSKARYSEPCQHCGYCCTTQLCALANMAFSEATEPPCPALHFEDDKSLCGLVLMEKHVTGGEVVTKCLGIGCGCSCPDADTTEDQIVTHDNLSHIKMFGRCTNE